MAPRSSRPPLLTRTLPTPTRSGRRPRTSRTAPAPAENTIRGRLRAVTPHGMATSGRCDWVIISVPRWLGRSTRGIRLRAVPVMGCGTSGDAPWDPEAFTAGWNLCYMPYWAGMLTEEQHPHPQLQEAIRQASWNLYFRDNAVCRKPDFVENPRMDLDSVLDGEPLLILEAPSRPTRSRTYRSYTADSGDDAFEHMKRIRRATNQSWVNIRKASRLLQGKPCRPFGTKNVENTSKSVVRRICRETGLSFEGIEALLKEHGLGHG